MTDVEAAGDAVEGIDVPRVRRGRQHLPDRRVADTAKPDVAQAFVASSRARSGSRCCGRRVRRRDVARERDPTPQRHRRRAAGAYAGGVDRRTASAFRGWVVRRRGPRRRCSWCCRSSRWSPGSTGPSSSPLITSRVLASHALWLSLRTSVAATALCVVLGVPMARRARAHRVPGPAVLRSLVLLPLVLPPVVGGIALLYTFGRRGLLGQTLRGARRRPSRSRRRPSCSPRPSSPCPSWC